MDERDELGWTTVIVLLSAATLSLFVFFVSLSKFAEVGPDVGDIVVFEAKNATREWPLSTVVADKSSGLASKKEWIDQVCVLSPSVMGVAGGSLVIEAKVTTEPPVYRVHWSGSHTDHGTRDCGTSADLTLPLASLRVLANSAGGFNVGSRRRLF